MEALRILDNLYVLPQRALIYKDYAIIADLHLGFEEEMAKKGVFLPPAQLKRALEVLNVIRKVAKKVIIAGDLKHQFSRLGKKEEEDVKKFLDAVEKYKLDLVLVRGNHDTFVRHLLEERGFDVVDRLDLGEVSIVHGHKDVELNEITIMGHEHPSISLRDPVGTAVKFPCFLKVPVEGRTVIVLPAIGLYQSGTSVSLSKEAYLSPIMKRAALEEAVPYVADEEVGVVEFPPLGELADVLVSDAIRIVP